jgi:acyl-CoA dehydrogenase
MKKARAKAAKASGTCSCRPTSGANHHVDDTFEFEGPALTNLEYALCAELKWAVYRLGVRSVQLLGTRYRQHGSVPPLRHAEQKKQWLRPLMNGEIRSAFLMTEPAVASSDATNIETRIVSATATIMSSMAANGGRRGAGDPRCKIAILMGKTESGTAKHQQQIEILVPMDTPGIKIDPMLNVFGYDDAPHGHAGRCCSKTSASRRRISCSAKAAASRSRRAASVPGRIHHCMRTIGRRGSRAGEDGASRLVGARRVRQDDRIAAFDLGTAHRRRAHRYRDDASAGASKPRT